MPRYCTFAVGNDGVENSRAFVLRTDANAIVWAKHLLEDRPIELWSGVRLVQRFLPPAPPKVRDAITYVIVQGRMRAKGRK
jgi:hypothetical protein